MLRETIIAWGKLFHRGKGRERDKIETTTTSTDLATTYIHEDTQEDNLLQTTITGSPGNCDPDIFGDVLRESKSEEVFRVGFQNLKKLPVNRNNIKSMDYYRFLSTNSFDVFLAAEEGLYWPKLGKFNSQFERLKEVFPIPGSFRFQSAFNTRETDPDLTQWGGTGTLIMSSLTSRVMSRGYDDSNLGRWSWIRLQGRGNSHIRVISAYRPCISQNGASSVLNQHYNHWSLQKRFNAKDEIIDPRIAFYQDLGAALDTWMSMGDQIIIGIDANEDVRYGATSRFFRSKQLSECILDRHEPLAPPSTQSTNTNNSPIDGIFCSYGLKATAAGYLGFGEGCESDHRLLWAEFTLEDGFGIGREREVVTSPRRLTSSIPKLVKNYNQNTLAKCQDNQLLSQLETVAVQASTEGWSPILESKYNSIHAKQITIRKQVEKNLRKLKMGGIPWSPKLQQHRDTIKYWSCVVKKLSKNTISSSLLRRLKHKLQIKGPMCQDKDLAITYLKQAYAEFKSIKKKGLPDEWRHEYLSELARQVAHKNNTSHEAELKKLLHIKKQRQMATSVKRMRGKLGKNVTNKLYMTRNGQRELVKGKINMEKCAMQENIQRFSQSEDTPAMMHPLITELGYLGEGQQFDHVLAGTYSPSPNTNWYAQLLLQQLAIPSPTLEGEKAKTSISTEDHVHGWRHQSENVQSDPDGLHFGHYKSACNQPELAKFDATLRSLPYQYGFSPTNWHSVTDVEILKKAGVYDIELMRTIQLFNAEFNMNNKFLGRDMMKIAEANAVLPPEQYGSRKAHRAVLAALNKRLTCDVMRQARRSGSLCANDAKSCYDRVVHNIAMLAMLCMGAPLSAIKCMFLTLQSAKHYISTAFGRSLQNYGNFPVPLQGLGQGNGSAPAAWAVISAPIIEAMRAQGYGFNFITALSATLVSFVCYSFVDDTDLIFTHPNLHEHWHSIAQKTQDCIDMWEGCLRATGGALVPSKSSWFLMDHKWNGRKWVYKTIAETPFEITVKDYQGVPTTLKRLECTEAIETLGVFLAMDGNNRQQIIKMQKKAMEFAEQVRIGRVTREEAWYAVNSTIMKTLEYPMEAINLTKKDWEEIMLPIWKYSLSKSGINEKFPRDFVYMSSSHLGLGVPHPWYTQNILQLHTLITQCNQKSITGELINASMEQLRLEMGLGGPITNKHWESWEGYITNCWLGSLVSFASQHDITINDKSPQLQPLREHDSFIMEKAILAGYPAGNLKQINECRMFLGATCISDLADAQGLRIEHTVLQHHNGNGYSGHIWPKRQDKLSAAHWATWDDFVKKHLLESYSNKLRQPLGKWLSEPKNWSWFVTETGDRLFEVVPDGFRVWTRTSGPRVRFSSTRYTTSPVSIRNLPPNTLYASVEAIGVKQKLLNTLPRLAHLRLSPHDDSYVSYIRNQSRDKWTVGKFSATDEGLDFADAIRAHTAIAVSDGSYKDNRGSSASILVGNDINKAILSANYVPGDSASQSAYRSELAGISGSLTHISAVCEKYNIESGTVTLALDGESALKAVSKSVTPSAHWSDYDLIMDIRNSVSSLPIQVKWKWVKGHQDDHEAVSKLDVWSQLNVIVDNLSKSYWNQNKHLKPAAQIFKHEGWSISYKLSKMSCIQRGKVYDLLTREKSHQLWSVQLEVPLDDIKNVDWEAGGAAFKQLQFAQQRKIVKFATNQCATGSIMERWGKWSHSACPRCGTPEENNTHVIKCKDPRAKTQWTTSMVKIDTWLATHDTCPLLRTQILKGLKSIRSSSPIVTSIPSDTHKCRLGIMHQANLGWDKLMLGMISRHWAASQDSYYKFIGKRNTGKKWATALIKKLWSVSWDMWDNRNQVLHFQNRLRGNKEKHNKLNQIIEDIYSTNIFSFQHWARNLLCNKSLNDIQRLPLREKTKWVNSMTTASSSNVSESVVRQQLLFQTWIQRG
jgi:hypothetical protein